jgi:hypothetical protein
MTDLSKHTTTTTRNTQPRIKRELSTVIAMIAIYCRSHHDRTTDLCTHCQELQSYALKRLRNCTYQENKPTCGNCPVHCYKPTMRGEIIEVMRYSGPRMMLYHPYLAFRHLLDGRRTVKKLSQPDRKKSIPHGESKP